LLAHEERTLPRDLSYITSVALATGARVILIVILIIIYSGAIDYDYD
jgi:hypothetical protein